MGIGVWGRWRMGALSRKAYELMMWGLDRKDESRGAKGSEARPGFEGLLFSLPGW